MGVRPDKICFACQKPRYMSDVTSIGEDKLICGPCARKFFKSIYRILGQLGFELKEGAYAGKGRVSDNVEVEADSEETADKKE